MGRRVLFVCCLFSTDATEPCKILFNYCEIALIKIVHCSQKKKKKKINIERNCHTLLGVPLGTGGVKEAIDGIITDMSKDFNCIMTADLPKQVRFALLRLCSQTKPTYLARALPAALVQSALQRFDKCVFTAASSSTCPPLPTSTLAGPHTKER